MPMATSRSRARRPATTTSSTGATPAGRTAPRAPTATRSRSRPARSTTSAKSSGSRRADGRLWTQEMPSGHGSPPGPLLFISTCLPASVYGRHRRLTPLGGGRCFSIAAVQAGPHELAEEWVGGRRFRLELGVALHRQEPRVVAQFDHLDQPAVGAGAG